MSLSGFRCYICGKKRVAGNSISHSGVRTKRIFSPNLQWKRIEVGGQKVRIRLCTKCLKRLKKDGKVGTPNAVKTEVNQEALAKAAQ